MADAPPEHLEEVAYRARALNAALSRAEECHSAYEAAVMRASDAGVSSEDIARTVLGTVKPA